MKEKLLAVLVALVGIVFWVGVFVGFIYSIPTL